MMRGHDENLADSVRPSRVHGKKVDDIASERGAYAGDQQLHRPDGESGRGTIYRSLKAYVGPRQNSLYNLAQGIAVDAVGFQDQDRLDIEARIGLGFHFLGMEGWASPSAARMREASDAPKYRAVISA